VAKDDQSSGSDNTHCFYPPVRGKTRSGWKLWKSFGSLLVARLVRRENPKSSVKIDNKRTSHVHTFARAFKGCGGIEHF